VKPELGVCVGFTSYPRDPQHPSGTQRIELGPYTFSAFPVYFVSFPTKSPLWSILGLS